MPHPEFALDTTCETGNLDAPLDPKKLGRQRPTVFKTLWSELGFVISLLGSMAMAEFFVSGFHIILPPLSIELDIPEASRTWPSSVFSLVTGAFLLPIGRLSDMHGAYIVFVGGLAWISIWCLAAGFSQNYTTLILCRAFQGFGSAAFLPAGITLLGKTYRPGPRKNLVFALYGAFAPLGFFLGILIGGISSERLHWRWYFWIGAIVLASICATSILCVPQDFCLAPPDGLRMDWLGVATIIPGLILIVYAITDSSQAPNGWASPQIIVTLVAGIFLLGTAVYIEGWVAANPLLPADLFSLPSTTLLVVGLFFAYGTIGIFLFYSSFYIELVLGKGALQTALWYIPMIVGGLFLGTVGGMTLHFLPGRILLIISGLGYIACCLLFALMPEDPNYWAWIMPAMIASAIGIDITFTVSNIFLTTNLPAKRQGLAGALINSTLFLGISFFQGIADVAVGQTSYLDLRKNYQVAFWLGVGIAGVAFVVLSCIKIGPARSELTVEEREQAARDSAGSS